MTKIKICGLMRDEDISYVNELTPDYIGFILSSGYRRTVDIETARRLKSKLNSNIKVIGVFVDEPINNIITDFIDIVQLHGNETPEYCSKINVPVIKMLNTTDYDKIKEYEPFVQYFLFDSGKGTGKVFEWNKIPKTKKPFFLAGGLSSSNIKKAIKEVKPFAVDISSSVETNGIKDYKKIKEVIDIVRGK